MVRANGGTAPPPLDICPTVAKKEGLLTTNPRRARRGCIDIGYRIALSCRADRPSLSKNKQKTLYCSRLTRGIGVHLYSHAYSPSSPSLLTTRLAATPLVLAT